MTFVYPGGMSSGRRDFGQLFCGLYIMYNTQSLPCSPERAAMDRRFDHNEEIELFQRKPLKEEIFEILH